MSETCPQVPDGVRDWLVAKYIEDPAPEVYPYEKINVPVVFVRFGDFASVLLSHSVPPLEGCDACAAYGWIMDNRLDLLLSVDPATPLNPYLGRIVNRLRLPFGQHRLVGILPAVLTPAGSATLPEYMSADQLAKEVGRDPAKVLVVLNRLAHPKTGNPFIRERAPKGARTKWLYVTRLALPLLKEHYARAA